mmetsp:Transcript_21052/g.56675  ORF Transcript_21052/g.56675 Transcript_21052/m.56675 type:complete len:229 (-) Transcript_21052:279-965(-)
MSHSMPSQMVESSISHDDAGDLGGVVPWLRLRSVSCRSTSLGIMMALDRSWPSLTATSSEAAGPAVEPGGKLRSAQMSISSRLSICDLISSPCTSAMRGADAAGAMAGAAAIGTGGAGAEAGLTASGAGAEATGLLSSRVGVGCTVGMEGTTALCTGATAVGLGCMRRRSQPAGIATAASACCGCCMLARSPWKSITLPESSAICCERARSSSRKSLRQRWRRFWNQT